MIEDIVWLFFFFFNPIGAQCATADTFNGQGQVWYPSESRTRPHGAGQEIKGGLQSCHFFHQGAHQWTARGLPEDRYNWLKILILALKKFRRLKH